MRFAGRSLLRLGWSPIVILVVSCTVLSSVATGCASLCLFGWGCRPSIDVTFEGENSMNGGHGTRVMVVQLSGDVVFRNTPIERFWGDDSSVLDEDLVGRRHEMLLLPLEKRGMVVETDRQARFLAVAANLRHPESDTWRWIRPMDDLRREDLCVIVAERHVTVDPC